MLRFDRACAGVLARVAFFAVGLSVVLPAMAQSTWNVPGHTPGEFSVSPSGSANFRVPIAVPPGVAGLVPSVALNYSSQGDVGIAGLGWSLDASSAVTRCPSTRSTDGAYGSVTLTASDRFCLDGQRLILVSGTYGAAGSEYRTEIDQFSRIVANGAAAGDAANGPQSFTVRTKDGRTLQYGTNDLSRVEANSISQTGGVNGAITVSPRAVVASWALSSLSDAKGNVVQYGYSEDNAPGESRLTAIAYAEEAGHSRSVHFHYEVRPDWMRQYRSGAQTTSSARLIKIETRIDSATVMNTVLTYASDSNAFISRLASIQQCDPQNNCLAPLNVAWTSQGQGGFTNLTGTGPTVNPPNNKVGDFNGDGIMDMARYTGNSDIWEICLGTGSGFSCSPQPVVAAAPQQTVAGDFNGDGRTDLGAYSGSGQLWRLCVSTGSAFSCNTYTLHHGTDQTNYSGDFNGDGRTDFAARTSGGTWEVCLSSGTGVSYPSCTSTTIHSAGKSEIGDFNGDGLDDIAAFTGVVPSWVVCLSSGTGTFPCFPAQLHTGTQDNNITADFNGDGLSDMMSYKGPPPSAQWEVCLSNGKGFTCTTWLGHGGGLSNNAVGDFNGDGKTDIAGYTGSGGSWHVCLSTGISFSCDYWSGGHLGGAQNNALGDFNGDGITDMAAWAGGNQWNLALSQKVGRPAVQSFTVGSEATTVSYQSMSAPGQAVYLRDSTAVYPVKEMQFPLRLVSQTTRSNGVGGTSPVNTANYLYGGMKVEQASAAGYGRGNLGFRWRRVTDLARQMETTSDYGQIWPYLGQTTQVITKHVPSGGASRTIKKVESQLGCYQTQHSSAKAGCPIGSIGLVYHIFPMKTIESTWDLDGALMPTVQTTRQLNGTADVNGVVRQLGDVTELLSEVSLNGVLKQKKLMVNEYWPAKLTGNDWLLGKLKKATVTASSYESAPSSLGDIPVTVVDPSPTGANLTPEQAGAFVPEIYRILLTD